MAAWSITWASRWRWPRIRRAERGCCRLLHHHEPGPLQVLHQPLRRDPGHEAVRLAHPLATVELEREGEGLSQILGVGRVKRSVGHPVTLPAAQEHGKNVPRGAGALKHWMDHPHPAGPHRPRPISGRTGARTSRESEKVPRNAAGPEERARRAGSPLFSTGPSPGLSAGRWRTRCRYRWQSDAGDRKRSRVTKNSATLAAP